MKGKEIIKRLNQRSTNPGARFEEILRKIFPQVAKDEGKSVAVNAKIGHLLFDLQLPQGIKDIKKPIWVEIKYFKEKRIPNILKSIEQHFGHPNHKRYLYYSGIGHISLNYILFILPVSLNEKDRQQILDKFKVYVNRYEIILWDIEDLEPFFQDYAEYIVDIVPELKEQAVKNIVDKSLDKTEETKSDPEFQIKKLNKAYKKDDLVLFLGAGVSVDAGLPSWDSLMSQLLLTLIERRFPNDINSKLNDVQKEEIASKLKGLNNSSPLQAARYINSGLTDDFEKEVSNVLYKKLNDLSENSLLNAIVKLCTPPRSGIGVKAITNYNFDDLVETILYKAGIKNRPIYNDNSFPNSDEIGIYHVHGFLPQNPEEFEGLRDSLLIFSEKNYHTIMSDPYNWSNLTQLNFFRENTCLFIGQSGTDPNLRRLLEIAKERTKVSKHFIILKRTGKEDFLNNFNGSKPDEKAIEAIIDVHHKLQEISFDEIGLNVIWIDEYPEIENVLNKIKN